MVSLPYLYIGYLAKKRRLFETPLSGRAKAGLIASTLGVVAGVLLTQSTDCVSLGEWTMGPLSILLDGAVGYGIIRLFLKWQRRVDGPISHAIEWVHTLWLLEGRSISGRYYCNAQSGQVYPVLLCVCGCRSSGLQE